MQIERGVVGVRGIAVALALWGSVAAAAPVWATERVPTPIVDITKEYVGQVVTVRAAVTAERPFKAGVRYILKDDSGEITLVLFERAKHGAPEIRVGAVVEAAGKVDFYKETAQLVPARGVDLVVVAQPPPPEPPAPMHTLSQADRGRRVTVTGVVVDAVHFSAGFKYILDDGSGRMQLVLFKQVYDQMKAPETLDVGAVVTATGQIDVFAEDLQLALGNAGDLVVVAGERKVREYELGRLSGNDHNAFVRVSGTVDNVQAVRGGVEWIVKDATGTQKVRMDAVVADRLAAPLRENAAGAQVIVIGRVRASRAAGLRIDVALPTDVRLKKSEVTVSKR